MTRKRILIVAMLDSIHTARWLKQFSDQEVDFLILSSKKFKHVHPGLVHLIEGSSIATYKLAANTSLTKIAGYLDFLFYVLPIKFLNLNTRSWAFKYLARKFDFDFVHALELQGAGYLVAESIFSGISGKFIATNWGSDIYYFQQFPNHKVKIANVLSKADYYSAECQRDYQLARELGFKGIDLPCIPNAGGFDLSTTPKQTKASLRSNIIAKAYGGDFGRGQLIIQALERVLQVNLTQTAFLYSVTDDLLPDVLALSSKFPGRVSYSERRKPLPAGEMRELFLNSRIYVGASASDGISTSFLEALVYGVYPIQTNTSCAGDWIHLGAVGNVVSLDVTEIRESLAEAISNDSLVDRAQLANAKIAEEFLSDEVIKKIALTFYS